MASCSHHLNDHAVRDIAARARMDVEEVLLLYEEEFAAVDAVARLKMFVDIFALRRTQDRVRARNLGFVNRVAAPRLG
jgi:hypothetical protein